MDNPKRDWYIWKKPKFDEKGQPEPPNNWSQILGDANSAWTYDTHTKEYYLSLFTPEQPDLNWENLHVRAAIHDVMHFWLKRGTSGFRMDVINLISKVQTFPDADSSIPGKKWQPGNKYYANGPRMHEYLKQIKTEVLDKYDTMTVGEMPWVSDSEEIIRVVNQQDGELNMIFIFDICEIAIRPGQDQFSMRKWTINDLKKLINKYQRLMIERNGWNSLFLENHDLPRSLSTFGNDSDQWRDQSAKLLALMHTTLAGTIYVYQGEELGMRNVPLSWSPEEYKDIESTNWWKKYGQISLGNLDLSRRS